MKIKYVDLNNQNKRGKKNNRSGKLNICRKMNNGNLVID